MCITGLKISDSSHSPILSDHNWGCNKNDEAGNTEKWKKWMRWWKRDRQKKKDMRNERNAKDQKRKWTSRYERGPAPQLHLAASVPPRLIKFAALFMHGSSLCGISVGTSLEIIIVVWCVEKCYRSDWLLVSDSAMRPASLWYWCWKKTLCIFHISVFL